MPADKAIPFRDRLTCSIGEAIEATGLSESTLYRMIDQGRLDTLKLGGRRLVRVRCLVDLLDPPPQAAE